MGLAAATSHRMMVLSKLPEANVLPSGLNVTLVTISVWPVRGEPICFGEAGLATSHRMMDWSALPDARVLPSGLKATLYTVLVWPWRGVMRALREATSHRMMDLSTLPEAR